MRFILCLLLALGTAAPAWAEWVGVGVLDGGGVTVYIDPSSIRKEGYFRKAWLLHDYKQKDSGGVMSRRGLFEYDCKDERFRNLTHSSHLEPMAKGAALFSDSNPGKWDYIPPDSSAATIIKFVCAM